MFSGKLDEIINNFKKVLYVLWKFEGLAKL